jgi:hypothetical protein
MSKPYQAIKGLGIGRGKMQAGLRTRLYQASDHLLMLQSTGYTEEYKRIAYENIRYVVVRKNYSQERQAMISLVLFLLSLLFLYLFSWKIVLFFCTPFAIWFILNLAWGKGCNTYINTDIQTIELPVPRRIKKVPILIDFLRSKTTTEPAPANPLV